MSHEEKSQGNTRYYTIAEGSLRVQVPKDHPEAVEREWKSPDGKTGKKYERVVPALFGRITAISVPEGDFGKNLNITLDEDEDGLTPVVSVSVNSRYGERLMKLLPSVDFSKDVRIRAYAFDGDNGKEVRGMEITQQDEEGKFTVKVPDFFYDSEKKEALNGYPKPDFDPAKAEKEDWQIFYKQANRFLVKYVEENIVPKFSQEKEGVEKEGYEYPKEDINPADVPF